MKASEGPAANKRDTDKPVFAHAGSVYWNEYRGHGDDRRAERGVVVVASSELWCAGGRYRRSGRGSTPPSRSSRRGPLSLLQPQTRSDVRQGRRPDEIFFEGTYTTISGNPNTTPRYDYNQSSTGKTQPSGRWRCRRHLRPRQATSRRRTPRPGRRKEELGASSSSHRISHSRVESPCWRARTACTSAGPEEKGALFYALPADAKNREARPLYECRRRMDGDRRAYAVSGQTRRLRDTSGRSGRSAWCGGGRVDVGARSSGWKAGGASDGR